MALPENRESRERSDKEIKGKKTVGGGIRNCCPPYETFRINPSFSYGISIINYLMSSVGAVNNGVLGAYYLNNLTFTSSQTFYKPDGTPYTPHCWSFIFDNYSVMSPTVDITDFTIGPAYNSWIHPKDDCTDIIQWRLNQVTNFPTVYGTQPCCPRGNTISIPNGVRSCCDPTIQYSIDPGNGWFSSTQIQVGSAVVGSFLFPVGSTPPETSYGCWEIIDDATGPLVGTLGAGFFLHFPDCNSIDLSGPNSPNIDECCPSATTSCDPIMIPLIKRLSSFKRDRDTLLNKQEKYTEKSIKELNDLGKGVRDPRTTGGKVDNSGGPGNSGEPPEPPSSEQYLCVDGECILHEDGNYDHIEACQAECGEDGGGGESGVPEECCTWCCHGGSKGEALAPSGCYDWMCSGDYCSC